jgi:hypothetical protein
VEPGWNVTRTSPTSASGYRFASQRSGGIAFHHHQLTVDRNMDDAGGRDTGVFESGKVVDLTCP